MVIKPSNWPIDVDYNNLQSFFGIKNMKKDCNTDVRIKKIEDKNSIVYGQYGLFAAKNFQKFDVLGQYTGEVVSFSEGGKYVAYCDKCNIDANKIGNEFRYINDYQNIAEEPNTTLRITYIDKKPRVLFVVTKDIKEDEEILTYYGKDYWKYINHEVESNQKNHNH